jgi:hypothetical protein
LARARRARGSESLVSAAATRSCLTCRRAYLICTKAATVRLALDSAEAGEHPAVAKMDSSHMDGGTGG